MIVNRSAPTATIVPVLVYEDVEAAIEFLVRAFGFAEHIRAAGPDGRVNHAQLRFADGSIIIGRQGGPFRAPSLGQVSRWTFSQHIRDVAPAEWGATEVNDPTHV